MTALVAYPLVVEPSLGLHDQLRYWSFGYVAFVVLGMAAILGGTMRSPLTGLVFAIELTHDVNALLPLLIACVAAHGFTVLVMSRSILTEKVVAAARKLTRLAVRKLTHPTGPDGSTLFAISLSSL